MPIDQDRKRAYMKEYTRNRRATDPEYVARQKEARKRYREKNKEKQNAAVREWREKNKDRVSEYNKQYLKKNQETIYKRQNQRKQEQKEHDSLVSAAWRERNKEFLREYNKEYTANRYKNDPVFKLKLNQRTRVRAVLKSNKKVKTHELLGCSFEELKAHIESLFVDGMGWHNMGQWHIDHIVPLAAFDLTIEANQRIAFHYKNLQPLWAEDNLKKGAKRA